jgi:hypothetical protein
LDDPPGGGGQEKYAAMGKGSPVLVTVEELQGGESP